MPIRSRTGSTYRRKAPCRGCHRSAKRKYPRATRGRRVVSLPTASARLSKPLKITPSHCGTIAFGRNYLMLAGRLLIRKVGSKRGACRNGFRPDRPANTRAAPGRRPHDQCRTRRTRRIDGPTLPAPRPPRSEERRGGKEGGG